MFSVQSHTAAANIARRPGLGSTHLDGAQTRDSGPEIGERLLMHVTAYMMLHHGDAISDEVVVNRR
jgi:hypothetical protein